MLRVVQAPTSAAWVQARGHTVLQDADVCEEHLTLWDTDGAVLASVQQVACFQAFEKMTAAHARPAKL
jgi:hypothetical protein